MPLLTHQLHTIGYKKCGKSYLRLQSKSQLPQRSCGKSWLFFRLQICLACEELQIHIAPASNNQLIALKSRDALPLAAHQCGLITKSDAERLISFLGMICVKGEKEPNPDRDPEQVPILLTIHYLITDLIMVLKSLKRN